MIIAHMGVSNELEKDELDLWLEEAERKSAGLFVLGGESASELVSPFDEKPLPTGSNKPNWALDSPPPLDINSFSSPKQIFSNFKLKAAGALNGGG